jgi:hypothetical protein
MASYQGDNVKGQVEHVLMLLVNLTRDTNQSPVDALHAKVPRAPTSFTQLSSFSRAPLALVKKQRRKLGVGLAARLFTKETHVLLLLLLLLLLLSTGDVPLFMGRL